MNEQKTIRVSAAVVDNIKSRLQAGQTLDNWFREWLGLPIRLMKMGRPRKYTPRAPQASEWAMILELKPMESVTLPWPTGGDPVDDEIKRRRMNPGVKALARRAGIVVQTFGTPQGLQVLRFS